MLIQFGGERRRGFVLEGGVRSLPVAVFHPCRDLDPDVGHAVEQGLIETLVAHVSVEALDITILLSVVKTFGTTRGVGLRSAGLVWV